MAHPGAFDKVRETGTQRQSEPAEGSRRVAGAVRLLPAASNATLAIVVALVSGFYFLVTILLALRGKESLPALASSLLFALLAWGMWRMSRFVRWVTVICLWIMVVMVPLQLSAMVVYAVPFVMAGLAILYILGKHKQEFKWP